MFTIFLALAAILTGLDGYFTYKRLAKYGSLIELNCITRWVARNVGTKEGVAAFFAQNVALIGTLAATHSDTLLHMLVGAKLALAAMQLQSLKLQHLAEKK